MTTTDFNVYGFQFCLRGNAARAINDLADEIFSLRRDLLYEAAYLFLLS